MSEELSVLSNHEIINRRKPLSSPFLLALLGALLLGGNWMIEGLNLENLQAALLLIGGLLFLWGAGVALWRIFSDEGAPYYPASGKYLRYEELCFRKELLSEVVACCKSGDLKHLRALSDTSVPAVVVAIYATPDGELTAWQPFNYVDLEYRPLDRMRLERS